MFKWLFNWIQNRSQSTSLAANPSAHSFPTAETIAEWDDQGLYVATGCESALRYHRDGFETLNQAERSLCCLYLLESDVNNGGFGQWIDSLCPLSAVESRRILKHIGATEMASLVAEVLAPLGDTTKIRSKEEWAEHYHSMPDDIHEHWETLTGQFLKSEVRFLELAYQYARNRWRDVRNG